MLVIEKRCAKCGKLFTVQTGYVFRSKNGHYCSWHCFLESDHGKEAPLFESDIPREKNTPPYKNCRALSEFRHSKGMTAREVAEIVGCDTSLILRIERGYQKASDSFKIKFERAFDISPAEMNRILSQERNKL